MYPFRVLWHRAVHVYLSKLGPDMIECIISYMESFFTGWRVGGLKSFCVEYVRMAGGLVLWVSMLV